MKQTTQPTPRGASDDLYSNHLAGFGASVGGFGASVGAAGAAAVALQPLAQGAAAVVQHGFGALQHGFGAQQVLAGLQQRTLAGRQQLRASAEPPTLNTTATAAAAANPNIRFILDSLKTLETQTRLPTLGVPTLPQQP